MRISAFRELRHVFLMMSVSGTVLPVAGQQPLARAIRVDWEPGREQRYSDRGIGVVHLAAAPGTGTARLDTILLRARPDTATVVIGAFLYTETQKGRAWRYSIAAPIRIEPNVLEFAYEEVGVPLDSVTVDASWGRALLGFDAGGTPYRGWVRLDPVRVHYRLWARELPGHSLFFLPEQGARVLDRPGGRALADIPPAEAFGDYILHPLKARGGWLQVRLARPADTCVGPEAAAPDTIVGWIRYLDNRGRPLVWYYTRGC
jgi:hypothetical protein